MGSSAGGRRRTGVRRRRVLGEDEQALWTAFVRGIKPLAARAARPAPVVAAPSVPPAAAPAAERRDRAAPPAAMVPQSDMLRPARPGFTLVRSRAEVAIGQRGPGLDDTSWRTLVSGKLRPSRTLDLHGQNAHAAFQRLHSFLIQARSDNLRCVEVITGLGSGREGGVLRRELPFWLGRPDLRPLILAVVHPHAANQGSVRILLRRGRG
ncbi:DNA mismatch repair protein [Gluconacetobacter takamatsuzukensis]|uniref:DNA mismatch repair protein n=1 Tax=Gluconacetobacter takamatsuzukensis TaxID=1286190 RepID=A0A7W4KCR9_9PROT|nr:Smr/MutS family protein [Gluconacetobacter takamatsuzukensis]MBB2204543.1 DNA mismatch repair protein [Gluconacetobacter takamatsuzukensis]